MWCRWRKHRSTLLSLEKTEGPHKNKTYFTKVSFYFVQIIPYYYDKIQLSLALKIKLKMLAILARSQIVYNCIDHFLKWLSETFNFDPLTLTNFETVLCIHSKNRGSKTLNTLFQFWSPHFRISVSICSWSPNTSENECSRGFKVRWMCFSKE